MASLFILLAVLFAGCDEDKPNKPGSDWKFGMVTEYEVDTQEQISLSDSVTGQQFLFPEGGHATLTVCPILAGPEAPYDGEGFSIAFDDEVPVSVIVDPTGCDQVMVMGYGTAPGAYDDIPGPSARWIAMPCIDSLEAGLAFQLTLPFESAGASARMAHAYQQAGGFSNYWVSSIPAGSDDATRRNGLELQSQVYVDGVLDMLSPARQTAARAEVDGRLHPHYAWDGLLYSGFWWRSLGSMGRLARPTIHLRLTANAGNVAHETGHYLTHVLVGDDVYSTLEGQAPLWDTGHGIRDAVGREMLLEDYAYFIEWLTAGSVKSYDLQDPYVIFSGMSPLTSDFPGIEGFAAVTLASLTRTTPAVRSLTTGNSEDVPVIGLSNAQVFDIIAQGASGIESLQERIATAVGSEADKLPAIFQRNGWRYFVKGRLLGTQDQPLSGATVSAVSLVGDHAYRGGSSSIPTGSDGRFTITGEVFPGASVIRVWDGQDSIDVPITIPWSQPTDETFDLGDLRVGRHLDLARMRYGSVQLYTDAHYTSSSGPIERYEFRETGAVPGSIIAGQFTGGRDTTQGYFHTTVQMTAALDTVSGRVETLGLTYEVVGDAGSDHWTETFHLTLHDIEMTNYYPVLPYISMECLVTGEDVCQHISDYTWSRYGNFSGSDTWQELTSYNCVPIPESATISSLRVVFYVY